MEGSREDPDGRNGKMSERNFPHVPISPRAVSAWGFTMKMVQKRSPMGGGLFCDALQTWTCLKSSAVWVYSHPRPISTKTETINLLHRNFWNPGIFSETEVT